MKSSASFLFAYRMLFPKTGRKSNARRSLTGAFLCIAISLIPLVMVMTVSNGMIKGLTCRMIGLSSSHLCAVLHPDLEEAKSSENLKALALKISEAEGVCKVYPELQSVGLAAGKSGRTGAHIRAVSSNIFQENPGFSTLFEIVESTSDITSCSQIVLTQGKNAVIGKKLAEILDLHAGDDFRLITTRLLPDGKILPKLTKFKISAVVSSGYQELDALWVFIPLETGYSILPLKATQVMLGIETEDPFSYSLGQTMSRVEHLVPNFTRVYRWDELNAAQYENFSSTQMMLLVIMLLIVLVASVNISSALVMLVMERRKEIAILKSLGASPSGITLSFLITGMITGGMGVLLGIPLGLVCAVNFDRIIHWLEAVFTFAGRFYFVLTGGNPELAGQVHLLDPAFYLQNIPLSIPLGQLVIIGCGTLILSLLVSAIPAIKAGSEKPIETLRKI